MPQFLPASREASWQISAQGFQSRNLFLDISPNGDGFTITFKTPEHIYKLFFAPTGQITHVRHYDAQAPMAASILQHDNPGDLRSRD